jgi:CBS domain-containing protein
VQEIMTPVVFSVPTDAPIARMIQNVLALEVRCLFVTDKSGVLVGVISVFDLLRTLEIATPERNRIGSVVEVAA